MADVVYLTELTANLNLATQLRVDPGPFAEHLRVELGALVQRIGARFGAIGRVQGVEVFGVWPDAPVWARANPVMVEQAITATVCERAGWTMRFEAAEPKGLKVLIVGQICSPQAAR